MVDYTTILSPLSQETLSRETLPDKTSALLFDASIEGIVPSSLLSGDTVSNLSVASGYLQSSNFITTSTGWRIDADGVAEFESGYFRGDITGASGTFSGALSAATITGGTITAATFTAADITSGTITAVNITGSDITGTTIKAIENFTAGESITAGNVVCIKSDNANYVASAATYADERFAATNYGTATIMRAGDVNSSASFSYVQFDESGFPDAQHILKAELHIKVDDSFGDAQTLDIYRVAASWDESTLTWNDKPAVTSDVNEPGGYIAKSGVLAYTDYYTDITELVRNWKLAVYTNYGLRISGSASVNDWCDIATEDHATAASRVSLRIYATNTSDEKIYQTDSDDYNLCRNVLGIATTTVATDATCTVQTMGKNDDVAASGIGDIYYISPTAGDITNDVVNQTRLIRVGTVTTTNELLIEKDNANIFIEKYGPGRITAASTEHTVAFPPDAKYAIVKYHANLGSSTPWAGNVRIDAVTLTSQLIRDRTDTTYRAFELTVSYSNNGLKLVIDSGSAASGAADYLQYTINFYK